MGRKPSLAPNRQGLYNRRIGYLRPDSTDQLRFYLGRDEREARLANARLEKLWEVVKQRAARDGGKPCWCETTLSLGKAFAAGERVRLGDDSVVSEVSTLRQLDSALSGSVRLAGLDEALAYHSQEATAIESGLAEVAGSLNGQLASWGRTATAGQTTHQAMRLYLEWAGQHYLQGGALSQTGAKLIGRVNFIGRFLPDIDLAEFAAAEVGTLIDVIAARPVARTNAKKETAAPISKLYATKTIGVVRHMLRWWHQSKQVRWRRPDDLELSKQVKVTLTKEERLRQASPVRLDYYTVDELVTLWRYAASRERLFMLLALNCGFGAGEIAYLRQEELHLRTPHPNARLLDLFTDKDDSWIIGIRNKTGAFGQWRLWDVTVAGLDWWAKHRPSSPLPEVFVTQRGKTYYRSTLGGNHNQDLANGWQKLLDRVKVDCPSFRDLSFNKLRKSGATHIRRFVDDSVVKLYTFHGDRYEGDDNLTRYANAPWTKLFSGLRELRDYLKPVWDSVADPFADDGMRQGGANISQATIDRIGVLRRAGWKVGKIASEVGVSRETVRRWIKRNA